MALADGSAPRDIVDVPIGHRVTPARAEGIAAAERNPDLRRLRERPTIR
ncbi:hypothetical protein [Frankia sp. QA3]|nr:hypothetical protein [Frankia sp. QA3]